MKNTLLVLFLLSNAIIVNSQDVDMTPIAVSYMHLPSEPLPFGLRTYQVRIDASDATIVNILKTTRDAMGNYIKLTNFKKIEENPDFIVELYVGEIKMMGASTQTKVSTTKNKSGKETKKTEYYKDAKYTFSMGYRLLDKLGIPIRKEVSVSKGIQSYQTDPVANSNWLESDWEKNGQAYIYNAAIASFRKEMLVISQNLIIMIDVYAINNQREEMETIDEKGEQFMGFSTAFNTSKSAFAKMKPEVALDSVKVAIQPAIDFYRTESSKFSPSDKKQYKYLHVCLYNLALIHYWLDDLVQAEQYAKECMKIDWKNNRTEKLVEEIEVLKVSLDKAGLKDRHSIVH